MLDGASDQAGWARPEMARGLVFVVCLDLVQGPMGWSLEATVIEL